MTRENSAPTRRASLELLRAEAADELSVLVEERLRAGEDPWEFMDDLPTVDELVVLMLRAENILTTGLPSTGIRHYRVLRQIALDYPPLTRVAASRLRAPPHVGFPASRRSVRRSVSATPRGRRTPRRAQK